MVKEFLYSRAKQKGKRVIAVGTTSVRTLESMARDLKIDDWILNENCKLIIDNYRSWTNIFIYPGYKFQIVDAMITNFHLPKSSLLMLVSALAGRENIMSAYEEAIRDRYRFYSYGDAMLIRRENS